MKKITALHGFTLIEIMVVIVIIAIITTIAILSFAHFNQKREVALTAERARLVLKAAAQQAIVEPAVLAVRVTQHGLQFYRYWLNQKQQGFWKPVPNDYLSFANPYPDVINLYLLPLNATNQATQKQAQIVFFPNGTATSGRIKIQSTDQRYHAEITIAATGEIK